MSEKLKTVLKLRSAARSWVTRCSKKLDKLASGSSVNIVELTDAVEEFDKRMGNLDEAQASVEMELDESDLDEDIVSAAEFRDKARVSRLEAAKLIKGSADSNEKSTSSGSVASATRVEAKLPKLQLPVFSGDVTTWKSFWEQFKVVVDDSDMPDVTKFSYLQSLVKGEARAAIQGLALTGANYKTACDILLQRFGRKERIIFSHIQELLSIQVPRQPKVSILWKVFDSLQTHVRSLEALGISGEQYGVVLTPLILSRLPPELRMEWARDGSQREGDLKFLLLFLQQEIERRERSQTFQIQSELFEKNICDEFNKKASVGTCSALHTATETKPECILCGRQGHTLEHCFSLTKAPVGNRKDILKSVGSCFRCLETTKGHSFGRCRAKCARCKGKHHVLLCMPKQISSHTTTSTANSHMLASTSTPTSDTSSDSIKVSTVNTVSGKTNRVLLQTAQVSVKGQSGAAEAVVLFDTGSDKSYVSSRLVDQIGPEWVESHDLAYAAFGSDHVSNVEHRNVYNVHLQGRDGNAVPLKATEIPTICVPLCCPSVPQSVLSALGNGIKLVDVPEGKEVQVDILIGLDAYWKLMTSEMMFLSEELVAQKSVFGWVLSGSVPGGESLSSQISHQLFCTEISESSLKGLWDLESIGIQGKQIMAVDPVLNEFNKTVSQSDEGRYVVCLPWKSEEVKSSLLNNEKVAKSRLISANRRLSKDPELEARYHEVFVGMLKDGVIEEVPEEEVITSSPVFYLPHRPVVKESSLTTKVRPVFDASVKGSNGVSLNDCMNTGPNMFPDLPGILLRFRRWKVGLTADVTKAFLQIQVTCEDQDVHRFFWNDKGLTRMMRFIRVPFGNKSSPFLLNATLKYHLSQSPSSKVTEELSENLYMDDWLSGADEDSEACEMVKTANEVMGQAKMSLAKWVSNSQQVGDLLCREFQDKTVETESFKVLGIRWLPSEDCFSFDGLDVSKDLCVTKRTVLSLISRLFDPLGFLIPFIMTAKCMFQDIWRLGLPWDQVLPEELQEKFLFWIKGLDLLKQWRIPRRYSEVLWDDISVCQLQAFGDASQSAYGACVYLQVKKHDGTWTSSLIMARARVAPLKRISLPRLELLGALLCARLVVYVKQALKLPEDVQCWCWTDSAVALAWIQSDPYQWKPFVGNRVAEIQDLISPTQWRHCPGKDNPADLVTRGISAEELLNSQFWLKGPAFLTDNTGCNFTHSAAKMGDGETDDSEFERCEKSCEIQHSLINVAQDEAQSSVVEQVTSDQNLLNIDIERWSSLTQAMRVIGWVHRFLFNIRTSKENRRQGDLLYSELCDAKFQLLMHVQKKAFPEELKALGNGKDVGRSSSIFKLSPCVGRDGLLRVEGRLQFSGLSYEAQHPVIVPKGHFATLVARHIHQVLKHGGVNSMLTELRNQYWIVGARRVCKRVKHECVSCQRLDAPPGRQIMAPLPELRVKEAPPFSVTGIDHGGPLFCCDFPGKKFYVLLFTCAVIRAVHLELVDSLSGETTVMALRRFFARRGTPSVLMSDNAKGFLAARDQLKVMLGSESPDWKCIPPRAPWWGGWWERLIASLKSALKRSVGKKSLTRSELETTLHEVEACLNSRPLTFVGDEVDSGAPLTPSHFLLGKSPHQKLVVDSEDVVVSPQELVERQDVRQQLMDKFWFCWTNEYIRNLPPCKGGPVNRNGVRVGSVVLIRGEGSSRLEWPLGVVQAVHPGRDGLVRAVDVKTAKGVLTRPIQKVHDLEINDAVQEPSPNIQQTNSDTTVNHTACDTHMKVTQSDVSESMSDVSDSERDSVPEEMCSSYRLSRSGRSIKKPEKLNL